MEEYVCSGELANLYYALEFMSENLSASKEHVQALQELLIEQYIKQTGESRKEALVCFDEWRSSGENYYTGNDRKAGRRRYKLTSADVEDIRQAKAEGQSTKSLAAKYNVSDRYIRKL